jgi:uncharacterized protein (DUF3820 family)
MTRTTCPYCSGRLEVIRDAPPPHWGRLVCWDCRRCLGFAPTPMEPEAIAGYTMPFGKHRGRTLTEIGAIDRPYLEWAARNLVKPRMREVITFYLEHAPEEVCP